MKKILDSNTIKLIAILAMTIDHITWLLFPGYPKAWLPIVLHMIGRLTCPIMCYCIAEGYHYTHDIDKYTKRLFVFALLSHFAYVFASADFVDWTSFVPFWHGSILNQTSVMWSLAWGLVMLRTADSAKIKQPVKILLIIVICLIALPSDWSCIASLCILAFGSNRGNFKAQMTWMLVYVAMYAVVYALAMDAVYGLLQMAVVLAVPVLWLYNGQRGNPKWNTVLKWLFYIYYPLHLFVIGCVQYTLCR